MIELTRTDSSNADLVSLVQGLDVELAERDGSEHAYYAQFNKIDMLAQVVVAYSGGKPVGCGAIKPFDDETVEIKRMYTLPEYRGQGIAGSLLSELETWAAEEGFDRCVLETGKRQPEAIRLYERSGYKKIPNYGLYVEMENSVCFEKRLIRPA